MTAFGQRSKFAEAFQSANSAQSDSGKFLAELRAVVPEEWPGIIRKMVSDQLSLLLRRNIDPDRPLSDYGLDSLGNLELRTRIETETGVRIGPTQITTVRGSQITSARSSSNARRYQHPRVRQLPRSWACPFIEEKTMRVGPLEIGSITDWSPVDGPVVMWQPTARSLAKLSQAPVSSVPVGYMQSPAHPRVLLTAR